MQDTRLILVADLSLGTTPFTQRGSVRACTYIQIVPRQEC